MADNDDRVELTDLDVIARYSLAVRAATASRADLIATLRSDLTWLEGGRARRTSSTPAAARPAVARPAPAPAATPRPAPEKRASEKRAPAAKKATAKKATPVIKKTGSAKKTAPAAKKAASSRGSARKGVAKKTTRRG